MCLHHLPVVTETPLPVCLHHVRAGPRLPSASHHHDRSHGVNPLAVCPHHPKAADRCHAALHHHLLKAVPPHVVEGAGRPRAVRLLHLLPRDGGGLLSAHLHPPPRVGSVREPVPLPLLPGGVGSHLRAHHHLQLRDVGRDQRAPLLHLEGAGRALWASHHHHPLSANSAAAHQTSRVIGQLVDHLHLQGVNPHPHPPLSSPGDVVPPLAPHPHLVKAGVSPHLLAAEGRPAPVVLPARVDGNPGVQKPGLSGNSVVIPAPQTLNPMVPLRRHLADNPQWALMSGHHHPRPHHHSAVAKPGTHPPQGNITEVALGSPVLGTLVTVTAIVMPRPLLLMAIHQAPHLLCTKTETVLRSLSRPHPQLTWRSPPTGKTLQLPLPLQDQTHHGTAASAVSHHHATNALARPPVLQ